MDKVYVVLDDDYDCSHVLGVFSSFAEAAHFYTGEPIAPYIIEVPLNPPSGQPAEIKTYYN